MVRRKNAGKGYVRKHGKAMMVSAVSSKTVWNDNREQSSFIRGGKRIK